MGKCETKSIQADLGILMHILAYSDIFGHKSSISRNYSGIFRTLYNPSVFRTLVYSESWHIQNQRNIQNPVNISGTFTTGNIFRILGYSEPEAYSEPCQKSTMKCFEKQLAAIIIFASYNHHYQLFTIFHEINMIFLI